MPFMGECHVLMSWLQLGSIQGLAMHSHIYDKSVNAIQTINVCVCVWELEIRWAVEVIFSQPSSNQALSPPRQNLILIPLSLFHAYCGAAEFFFPSFSSCSASYCKLQCIPSLFGFIPLLHAVPWVPKGDRQRMRTLIVTPARAKPCIFNLLWHYSPSLSLPPSLFLSLYYHPEHPVRQPQLDSHPAETFHLGPANLGVPSAAGACALLCVCVYKCVWVFTCVWIAVTFAVQLCFRASQLVSRGGEGVCIHWPSVSSERLVYVGSSHWKNTLLTVCKCLFMKLIALLRKSSGC